MPRGDVCGHAQLSEAQGVKGNPAWGHGVTRALDLPGSLVAERGRWPSSMVTRDITGQKDEQMWALLRSWSRIAVSNIWVPRQG